ncbi:hypothetical protein FSARC_7557 [Fusarium sarcochroum]|uniref:Uncharacterized protein n=1 Tax=Fusarium sarcochroum TaxID=1208366 RepID=A0A8H4TUY4_9HYPO|nr:hypothetical protein FSARC_7557 [Fusarium sarcochroum]
MPCYQGVEVAIVTQPDSEKLPEFPLLDASLQRISPSVDDVLRPNYIGSNYPNSGSQHVPRVSPRISVYVPSHPGTRFGIHYALDRKLQLPRYVYFKIFMNGRNVTNCGVNPASQTSGSITRSLCEPSDRWQYKEHGVLLKRDGIEARCFSFLPHATRTSIAEDGGFIEVQVFRAKGRRRRITMLENHRGQETYGIGSPSGGLLESPEDARFYDWILIDPKESPFVSFRFHYRSWANLRQLSLAPDSTELNSPSTQTKEDLDETATSDGAYCSTASVTDMTERHLPARLVRQTEGIPKLSPPNAPARPLPEIPVKRPVLNRGFESNALTHTPSLLSDIQEEMEEAETSMTATFPKRSDSLRSAESRSPAKTGSEKAREVSVLLEKETRLTIKESLICAAGESYLVRHGPVSVLVEEASCTEDQTQARNTSGIVSIVAEAERSFKTGWRLSESEWMRGENC